jgi:S-adenosylmethionine-diacylgycerolhomoserine-N-methlytransferase
MTNYYRVQSVIYDQTRWAFLYGRERLIDQLDIRSGDRVIEIGCGTGQNFGAIQRRLQGRGELIGIDCSAPMLRNAAARVSHNGWRNVRLIDLDYGREPVTRGRADVALFSYSLSMIPNWTLALACAHAELWPGGRIGVVDFCRSERSSRRFARWLSVNHVVVDRPCVEELQRLFRQASFTTCNAWGGLWSFYSFTGIRPEFTSAPGLQLSQGPVIASVIPGV